MKYLFIFSISITSCTGLRNIQDRPGIRQLTDQTVSTLNGSYSIFTPDSAATTLDLALTLEKYWWKDWHSKNEYNLTLTAKDARHLDIKIYKKDLLLDKKSVRGKVKDGYFVVKSSKILFFYFLLNGFGQLTTKIGIDNSDNLVVDSHHLKFATLVIIPLTGDRREDYGLVFPPVLSAAEGPTPGSR